MFRQGLDALGQLYSQKAVTVLRIRQHPPDWPHPCVAYEKRGWPFTESCWSTLYKWQRKTVDVVYQDDKSSTNQGRQTQRTAGPPLVPNRFAQQLSACIFTNEQKDRSLVIGLYQDFFLHRFRDLTLLNFCNRGWGDTEISLVADLMEYVPQLVDLNVSLNNMTPRGCQILAAALNKQCPDLSSIDLGGNHGMGNDGIQAMASILPRLRSLDLLDCGIGDDGCTGLIDLVLFGTDKPPRLTHLNLYDNEEITASSCKALARLIEANPSSGGTLRLDGCHIGKRGLLHLQSLSKTWIIIGDEFARIEYETRDSE